MADTFEIARIDADSASQLAAFAQRHPLAYSEFTWAAEHIDYSYPVWTVRSGDEVRAAAMGDGWGRIVGGDLDALQFLAEYQTDSAGRRVLYGREEELAAYVACLPGERWWWPQQLMSIDRSMLIGEVEAVPIALATLEDIPIIVEARIATWADENRIDIPRGSDLEREVIASVESAVADQTLIVWRHDGKLAFTAELGAQTPEATIFYSLYTDSELRGRGYATRALTAWCDQLLNNAVHVVLRVGRDNSAAIRLYERVGFTTVDATAHSIKAFDESTLPW